MNSINLQKKDMMYMIILSLVYMIISLFNLGDMYMPTKGWIPQNEGEQLMIDFGRDVQISRISLLGGRGIGWNVDGTLAIDILEESEFKHKVSIEKQNVYKWIYKDTNFITKAIRITALKDSTGNSYKAEYLEMAFWDNNGDLVKGFTSTSSDNNSINLFNEQNIAVYLPTFMNSTYFDEVYHPRTAFEHIKDIDIYETTHPPLGKSLIAIGIRMFGMNPFGWRIIGNMFGVLMVPLMYLFGKLLFKETVYAFATSFIFAFDFMHFTQTRIATIDVYCTFFIILMYYFMADYFNKKTYKLNINSSLHPLYLCGIAFGLGAASKWITLYGAVGLALLFLWSQVYDYNKYKKCKNKVLKHKERYKWVKFFIKKQIAVIALCIVFFIIIPAIIYALSYMPVNEINTNLKDYLQEVWSWQKHMYQYHSNVDETHSFASPWYEWPLIIRPMWYYSAEGLQEGLASSIVSMGNPIIWWVGILFFLPAVMLTIINKDKYMVVPIIAVVSQYVPWILAPRKLTFIYHFFSCIPFLVICLVYVLKCICGKNKKRKILIYGYLLIVFILFVIYYPIISGLTFSSAYLDALKIFESWVW